MIAAACCASFLFVGQAWAVPVATLLRVTLDGRPLNEQTLKSYGVETELISDLHAHSFTTIDLTPLHSDFQKLRYSYDCPVVDGSFNHNDCAKFGDYAEAVIQVLDNIREGVEAGVKSLEPIKTGGYILVGEVTAMRTGRNIVGEFHYRIHSYCSGAVSAAQAVNHNVRIGTADPAAALSQFYDDIIYRGVEESVAQLEAGDASCKK